MRAPAARSARRPASFVLAVVATLVLAAPAGAQDALRVGIREAAFETDGRVRLVVSVAGLEPGRVLDAAAFTVSESGRAVGRVLAEPVSEASAQAIAVVLAIDTSGSTRGQPIEDAKSAARAFVDRLPAWFQVAVVAFGPQPDVAAGFDTDRIRVHAAIDGLESRGETALYDAVVLAASQLGALPGQRNIVVFSDGADTVSRDALETAVAAANDVRAQVATVALQTPDLDRRALDALARQTGGRTLEVSQSAQLDAAFQQVADEITSQYVLTYTAADLGPQEIDLRVSVTVDAATASDLAVVLNPREARPAAGPSAVAGPLASPQALAAGLVAAFGAFALVLFVLLPKPGRRSARALEHALGLAPHSRIPDVPQQSPVARVALQLAARVLGSAGRILGRLVPSLTERWRRRSTKQGATETKLEVAGWPLRPVELTAVRFGAALAGGVMGLATGIALFGVAGAGLGWMAPLVLLNRRVNGRVDAFANQLPDTLQLLAASLEAGYGVQQGLDAVVKETAAPTSTEFGRALSEVRLGMPLQDALTAMAERVGSEDFRWVVVAMNIQREVGGNLATLLKTSSETLRSRAQLRRQAQVMSAEGRASGMALGLLPIGLTAYLAVVNPSYLRVLTSSPTGRGLAALAVSLMVAGALWMRKLVRIEV